MELFKTFVFKSRVFNMTGRTQNRASVSFPVLGFASLVFAGPDDMQLYFKPLV
jgi:hypothetical protein